MNKEPQQWVAENEELEEEDIHYCILDALAPLRLESDMKSWVEASNGLLISSPILPPNPCFVIDAMCKDMEKDFMENNISYILMEKGDSYESTI